MLGVEKIRIQNLSKSFQAGGGEELPVLEDISFTVQEGEFCSLLGPSGCGKTTLLRILAGIEKSGTGTVKTHSRARNGKSCAMIFQQDDLLPWLTVENNIKIVTSGRGKRNDSELIGRYLKAVKLEHFHKFYPVQLSGGMQKRVSLARALAMESEIILMDEPFSHIDFQTRTNLQELVMDLFLKTKQTVLYVTHNIHESIKLSKKIVVLTALPARVKAVVDVPFEYPRRMERINLTSEYNRLFSQISELLRDEIALTTRMEVQHLLEKRDISE